MSARGRPGAIVLLLLPLFASAVAAAPPSPLPSVIKSPQRGIAAGVATGGDHRSLITSDPLHLLPRDSPGPPLVIKSVAENPPAYFD